MSAEVSHGVETSVGVVCVGCADLMSVRSMQRSLWWTLHGITIHPPTVVCKVCNGELYCIDGNTLSDILKAIRH